MVLSAAVSIGLARYLNWWAVHAEVVQTKVHRLDLRFKIGDDPSEVPSGRAGPASILAFALAQDADRDRHPTYATREAVTLKIGAQGVSGSKRRGAHACAIE
jgi:hypothetical protein